MDGQGLGNVDLLQAAEFAGVSMLIPDGEGRLSVGSRLGGMGIAAEAAKQTVVDDLRRRYGL